MNQPSSPAPSTALALRQLGLLAVLVVGLLLLGRALEIRLAGPASMVLGTILIAVWLKGSGGLRAIGLGRPRSILKTILWIVGGLIATNLLVGTIQTLLASRGLTADVSALSFIEGNLGAYLGWLAIAWTTAAVGEEVVFRGFVLTRLTGLMGGGRLAVAGAVVLQAALFGLAHSYQGATGTVLTASIGLCLGTIYVLSKRNLWVVVTIHGLVDTVGLTAVYLGSFQKLQGG